MKKVYVLTSSDDGILGVFGSRKNAITQADRYAAGIYNLEDRVIPTDIELEVLAHNDYRYQVTGPIGSAEVITEIMQ